MQITTRGRYALRAMLDVALHAEEGPVSRRDIAVRQEVSADYMAQLFRSLSAASRFPPQSRRLRQGNGI